MKRKFVTVFQPPVVETIQISVGELALRLGLPSKAQINQVLFTIPGAVGMLGAAFEPYVEIQYVIDPATEV